MMTQEQKDYICQQYESGNNRPSKIAKELGLSRNTVSSFVNRKKLTHQPYHRWKMSELRAIKKLMDEGKEHDKYEKLLLSEKLNIPVRKITRQIEYIKNGVSIISD